MRSLLQHLAGKRSASSYGRVSCDRAGPGQRIDQFLCKCQPDVSRSAIQKWIKDGNVLVQGKACKANYRINKGDTIALFVPEPVEVSIQPQDIPLDILYEDKDLLIVNKPKGMVVHPAPGHPDGTLVNAIMYHCKESLSGINGRDPSGHCPPNRSGYDRIPDRM